jgi:hypothetical protein
MLVYKQAIVFIAVFLPLWIDGSTLHTRRYHYSPPALPTFNGDVPIRMLVLHHTTTEIELIYIALLLQSSITVYRIV